MMRTMLWLLVIAIAVVGWFASAKQHRAHERAATAGQVDTVPIAPPAPAFDPSRFRPVSEAMDAKFPMPPMPPSASSRPSVVEQAPRNGLACDGRTHCSQMHSCAEAQYFLAHCPGVKMDGNHDGEPCEQQFPECGS